MIFSQQLTQNPQPFSSWSTWAADNITINPNKQMISTWTLNINIGIGLVDKEGEYLAVIAHTAIYGRAANSSYNIGDIFKIMCDTKDMMIKPKCNDLEERIVAFVPPEKGKRRYQIIRMNRDCMLLVGRDFQSV